MIEVRTANELIARMDEFTQKTKNWAIVTWAGSIALVAGQAPLLKFLWATSILPVIFWILDGQWRRIQRRCIFRVEQLSDFLSNGKRIELLSDVKFNDMAIFDPAGRKYRGSKPLDSVASLRKTLFYTEVYLLYLAMFLMSLGVGACAWCGWIPGSVAV